MSTSMWIGGVAREGSQKEKIHSPYSGELVGEVSVGTEEDMEDAVSAAHKAFQTTRKMPVHERVRILETTVGLIRDHADELANLMVAESGKPIQYARGEVQRAALTFSLGVDVARREEGAVEPLDIAVSGEGRFCVHKRVPRGPVAAIAPFNFPLNLTAHKLSPALAVGASTVLKPAAQCPMTALRLVELMHEANLPPGAVNGLHVSPQVAQLMVEDERMRVLSFTGSAAVGWKLKSLAGQKQVCLELGGNAPVIVDDGVDIDSIMDRILMGSWAHGGQVCIKAQRIYVHEALFESFMESFVRETKALVCGDPTREDTVVGPLIDTRSRDRVMAWIQEAQAEGAHLHCGGESDGNVVAPTILTGVHSGMKVVAEEVFGPVTTVMPFSSYDQVLVEANRGPYGLQAGIFTRDVERAFQAFDALDYGGVMINDVPTFRVDNLPYGGSRSSGMGREGVRYAAEDFTEHKVLTFRRDV